MGEEVAGLGEVALGVVQPVSLQEDVELEKGHGAAGGHLVGLVEVLLGLREVSLGAAQLGAGDEAERLVM